MAIDTTKRPLAAETVATLDALPVQIALLDGHGVIQAVNEAWRRFATANGFADAAFAVGQSYVMASGGVHDDAQRVAAGLRRVLTSQASAFALEYPCHSPTEKRWFRMTATPLGESSIRGAVVMHVDITERKQAEDTLRTSEASMAAAQRIAHLGSWELELADVDVQRVRWSDEMYRICGYEPGAVEIPPGFFYGLVHPDDRAAVRSVIESSLRDRQPFALAHRLVRPDGSVRFVQQMGQISSGDASGQPPTMVGTAHDITEQRNAEEALRRSENEQRQLAEELGLQRARLVAAQRVAKIGSWETDPVTLSVIWSDETHRIFETDQRSFAPTHEQFLARVHPADRANVDVAFVRSIRDRTPCAIEHRIVTTDGRTKWVEERWQTMFAERDEPTRVIGTCQDITDRKQAERSRNRLASIVESSEDAVFSTDVEGVIESWNHGAERLFGWSELEILGRPILVLVPPDLADEESRVIERITRGESVEHYETRRLRRDGSPVEVAITASPIRDATGEVIGVSKIVRDLAERRKAEERLRTSEEHLRQAQKMEAIGQLAGGIAHDFNNLLSVILSYSSMVADALGPNDPLRDDVEEVRKAGVRAANLTTQLLAYSRKQILQPTVLDVNGVVVGLEKMLARMLGEDIELSVHLARAAGNVHADRGQLEQVLMNIAVNARDAMPKGGSLTVETGSVELDAGYASAHGIAPGPYVVISATDTGIGMDRATQERIFDPFFTTKDTGKGTGLGLATVYSIVQQSSGHVSVDSTPGKGTTFKIYLPKTHRPADAPSEAPLSVTARGSETILLVEDEPEVRAMMRTLLRKGGYEVLEAQNGGEAFLLGEQFTREIQLLVTDVVMPRMSGPQLADRIARLHPEMKVLYVSGYTDDTIVRHGVLAADIHFLAKPITPAALLRKVREVLDSPLRGVPQRG